MAEPPETSNYRLLVEGRDDKHSVIHLMRRHGFDWDDPAAIRPHVAAQDGIEELLKAIPVAAKGPYQRLGVIVDAETSVPDRWTEIRERCGRIGLELPEAPSPGGTTVAGLGAGSRIGFWLMPDNRSPGRLEEFLARLVPRDDRVWPYADEVSAEARRRGALCPSKDHIKSVIHCWLAWQEPPGLPFGTALKAAVFRHDGDEAVSFVAWFRQLFVG
jgi:hypothetical protein